MGQVFTPTRVEQLRGRIQHVCDRLLDDVPKTGAFDLVRDYALPIPLTVISELLGIPAEERRQFHRLAEGSLRLGTASQVLDCLQNARYDRATSCCPPWFKLKRRATVAQPAEALRWRKILPLPGLVELPVARSG